MSLAGPLKAHPLDDCFFYVDLTEQCESPDGTARLVESVVITAPAGVTVSDEDPNADAFTNDVGDTVAVGKGVVFRMSFDTTLVSVGDDLELPLEAYLDDAATSKVAETVVVKVRDR